MTNSDWHGVGKQLANPTDAALGQMEVSPTARAIWGIISTAGVGLGAYHGYKRNDSVGWAIAWALLGGAFPVITIPVSFAQGFAKRKVD